jgi:hypothetical protein
MKYPKFIIENDCLILGKVTYHKELCVNKDNVAGGGWFMFKPDENLFIFSGESHDFGKARFNKIKECVENKKVFQESVNRRNLSDKHKFAYNTGLEIIPLNY